MTRIGSLYPSDESQYSKMNRNNLKLVQGTRSHVSLKVILHHKQPAILWVSGPNLPVIVRSRRVRALSRFHRCEFPQFPLGRDSDDGQRSLLRVGYIDMSKDWIIRDQVRALSNIENAKYPSVMDHVNYRHAPGAGSDEE